VNSNEFEALESFKGWLFDRFDLGTVSLSNNANQDKEGSMVVARLGKGKYIIMPRTLTSVDASFLK
jgi:hypothetical protein